MLSLACRWPEYRCRRFANHPAPRAQLRASLAMVNVTNRPHVHVRLVAFKFLFRHFVAPYVCRPYGASTSFLVYPGLTPGLNSGLILVWRGHSCPGMPASNRSFASPRMTAADSQPRMARLHARETVVISSLPSPALGQ